MADITVRKDVAAPARAASPTVQYDPYRAIRDMLQWDPFREMAPVWPNRDDLTFAPAFEVKELKDTFLFKADVPGVKESDINVTVTGNRLTISGERSEEKEEKDEQYYTCERRYGSFRRSYTLPDGADVDHVHADLKAGVLTVAVPKTAAAQPKKIAVKSSSAKA